MESERQREREEEWLFDEFNKGHWFKCIYFTVHAGCSKTFKKTTIIMVVQQYGIIVCAALGLRRIVFGQISTSGRLLLSGPSARAARRQVAKVQTPTQCIQIIVLVKGKKIKIGVSMFYVSFSPFPVCQTGYPQTLRYFSKVGNRMSNVFTIKSLW